MTIGERAYKAISDRADQEGFGIVAYAKSIGISQPNLAHWKNAHSEPRAYLLSLMAEAGLDVHWILTGQRVDKVEVVRCSECQHADYSGCANGMVYCMEHSCRMDENGYCSDGEREVADNAAD